MKQRVPHLGFSLIELLIVLALITLLVAILLPALVQSRAKARQSACQSNLRQIGAAMALYLADNDERFPPYTATAIPELDPLIVPKGPCWADFLPLASSNSALFACPGLQDPRPTGAEPSACGNGYALNGVVNTPVPLASGGYAEVGRPLSEVRFPARFAVVYEVRAGVVAIWATDDGKRNFEGPHLPAYAAQFSSERPGGLRHFGLSNYLFADGHVKAHNADEFWAHLDEMGKADVLTFLF